MEVEVLRCFKTDNGLCGEYYISEGDSKHLAFQNYGDIKLIVHWQGKKVEDCITRPTQEAKDAIIMASIEYLKQMKGEKE